MHGWGLLRASRTPQSRLAGGGWALRLVVRPVGRVVAGSVSFGLLGPVGWLVCAGLACGSVSAPSPVGSGFLSTAVQGVEATCIYAGLWLHVWGYLSLLQDDAFQLAPLISV